MSLTRRERRALMQLEGQFDGSSDVEILRAYEHEFVSRPRWWLHKVLLQSGDRWLNRFGWLAVLVGAIATIVFLTSTVTASLAGAVVLGAGLFILTRRSACQRAAGWFRRRFGPPATSE